jgi:hypothetical protein
MAAVVTASAVATVLGRVFGAKAEPLATNANCFAVVLLRVF